MIGKLPQYVAVPIHFNEFAAFAGEIDRAVVGPLGCQ